jgi:Lipoxygenase
MRKRESDWEVYLRSAPQHSAPVRKTAPPTPGETTRSIEVGPSEVSPPTAAPAPKDAPGGIVGRIEGLVHDVIDDIEEFLFPTYYHLPLRLIYPRAPAIPVSLEQTVDTLGRLLIRTFQTKQAMQGLTNRYKLDGLETYGRDFLFNQNSKTRRVNNLAELKSALGPNSATEFVGNFMKMAFDEVANTEATEFTGPLTQLSLEDPMQWTIGWTTLPPVYQSATAQRLDARYSTSLTSADEATRQFWPMIAEHGLAYNLLILEKVNNKRIDGLKKKMQTVWSDGLTRAYDEKRLYLIDLEWFEKLKPHEVRRETRFTPGSLVLLIQDAKTKMLIPVAVKISTQNGDKSQIYGRSGGSNDATDSAWIYSLLAAKVSITVWGIWLGHVYHWHLVTAAMQMTMYNNLKDDNPVYKIVQPQSNFLIGFDNALLLGWGTIAPPTSIASVSQYLALINDFANGRGFFDDDPINTLEKNGIEAADFTIKEPWDQYPIVGHVLAVWDATHTYIDAVVKASYPSDSSVQADEQLQAWIKDSGPSGSGNIAGLPDLETVDSLVSILTSLIFRVTIHGCARLYSAPNPSLTFVSNFPPCLERTDLVAPTTTIDIKTTLTYLPKTGTIGEMLNFYFTFAFSVPYEPFIPLEGIDDTSTLFYGEDVNDPSNQALIAFRKEILEILLTLDPGFPQVFQWPLNIET